MSDYIYRPPPPPPPPNSSGNRANPGGYSANSQPGIGSSRGGRARGSHSGGFNRGGGGNTTGGGRWGNPNNQRQPHPLPQFPPATHYNPIIAQQQYQQYQQYPLYQQQSQLQLQPHPNQIYTGSHYQPPSISSPAQQPHNPYLSYSQEHYQSQHPQTLPPKPPQQQQPLPTAGWPTHSSYGQFNAPPQLQQPSKKQQRRERDDKPDMDEATWLSLNGGKLIGTNIIPPETPEEIEAWIAQRKSRFPTAKKIEESMAKKQEAAARVEEEEAKRATTRQRNEMDLKTHATGGKRKRAATDTGDGDSAPTLLMGSDIDNDYDTNASGSDPGDDDAPPEVASSKVKPTVPEAKIQRLEGHGSKKSTARCRDFLRGKCPKGDRCRFRHENSEPSMKREVKTDEKKSLYQRLVEYDREKENTLMLQVIQYLIDKGQLLEETSQKQGETDTK